MAKSSPKLKILYCESEEKVLASQVESVQKAGHQVASALGRKAAEEALRRESFDLVILGDTLSKDDRHHLPYMGKKAHTGTRVLVTHAAGRRHHEVDAVIDSGMDINTLLDAIASLLQTKEAAVTR
jgi:DNA-binding NtrC family response regulator